jgi:hypothetical protein
MAQQKSILKLQGTIGGITFYKSKDGYLAREKGGVDASRIANDPGFARTRENGAEFANAASAGKLLRDATRVLSKDASDGRVTARLTQIMTQVKNMDDASARGERSVATGMGKNDALLLLKGFDFNADAVLGTVLHAGYQVDTATGEITIASLSPQNDISLPDGATHVVFRSGFASVNFETGESEMTVSDPVRLATTAVAQALSVKPAKAPALASVQFILLSIDFVQSVNNADYSLKNNAYNVLSIIEVVRPVTQ